MGTIQEIGRAEYVAATSLKCGDEILTAGSIKRIVSDPHVCLGYVHFDVHDVLGLGRGGWNVRRDVEVSVLRRALTGEEQ